MREPGPASGTAAPWAATDGAAGGGSRPRSRARLAAVLACGAALAAGGPGRAAAASPGAGTTLTLHLPAAAPNARHPEVLVHAPPTFAATGPVNVVLFLHGYSTCVAVVTSAADAPCHPGGRPRPALDVVAQFDAARPNALLIVPQLAYEQRSSAPGRLGAPGGLKRLIAAVLAAPELEAVLGRRQALADLGRVVVFAHSGAIVPLIRVLLVGGVDVAEAHLLDALYRYQDDVYAWVRARLGRFSPDDPASYRLTFVYTDREHTGPGTRRLLDRLARLLPHARAARTIASSTQLVPPAAALLRVPIVAVRSPLDHDDIPRRLLAPLLALSPLAVGRAAAGTPRGR